MRQTLYITKFYQNFFLLMQRIYFILKKCLLSIYQQYDKHTARQNVMSRSRETVLQKKFVFGSRRYVECWLYFGCCMNKPIGWNLYFCIPDIPTEENRCLNLEIWNILIVIWGWFIVNSWKYSSISFFDSLIRLLNWFF
jgi:hypothetical protein